MTNFSIDFQEVNGQGVANISDPLKRYNFGEKVRDDNGRVYTVITDTPKTTFQRAWDISRWVIGTLFSLGVANCFQSFRSLLAARVVVLQLDNTQRPVHSVDQPILQQSQPAHGTSLVDHNRSLVESRALEDTVTRRGYLEGFRRYLHQEQEKLVPSGSANVQPSAAAVVEQPIVANKYSSLPCIISTNNGQTMEVNHGNIQQLRGIIHESMNNFIGIGNVVELDDLSDAYVSLLADRSAKNVTEQELTIETLTTHLQNLVTVLVFNPGNKLDTVDASRSPNMGSVYVGSEVQASSSKTLRGNNITVVVNVPGINHDNPDNSSLNFFENRGNVEYITGGIADATGQRLPLHLIDQIHEARSSGKNVLIHCKEGKGRAPAISIAYLIKYGWNQRTGREGMTFDLAHEDYYSERKRCVLNKTDTFRLGNQEDHKASNPRGFVQQLMAYEKSLRG